MSDWAFNLDNLAANGVIDFDAPAFLLGQKPRYIGNPSIEGLPLESLSYLPENIKLKDLPSDCYENSKDGNLVHNPTWKKILFGGIAIAGAVLATMGIFKLKGNWKNVKKGFSKLINKIKMPSFKDIGKKIGNIFNSIWNFVKKPFKK